MKKKTMALLEETIKQKDKENERLNNIINEVRGYTKEAKIGSQEVENIWAVDICNMVLEILDKVGDIK